ncbi:MAG: phage regulatory CII family protein [Tepidisphaeraceae bacterium]
MKSFDVIRQAVDEPGVKAVAAALKVSPALVYKWCEQPADSDDPDQSGARNPLDRVREMYLLTKDIRLVRWLCNEAGGFFVANPVPELRKSMDETIFNETRSMVREFSELLDTVTEAYDADYQIDPNEADEIREKWEDLKACLERFTVCAEKGHFRVKKKDDKK